MIKYEEIFQHFRKIISTSIMSIFSPGKKKWLRKFISTQVLIKIAQCFTYVPLVVAHYMPGVSNFNSYKFFFFNLFEKYEEICQHFRKIISTSAMNIFSPGKKKWLKKFIPTQVFFKIASRLTFVPLKVTVFPTVF